MKSTGHLDITSLFHVYNGLHQGKLKIKNWAILLHTDWNILLSGMEDVEIN